jgi:hypothetical protein
MKKHIVLTDNLNKFIQGTKIQQIDIGCSGDALLKLKKEVKNV